MAVWREFPDDIWKSVLCIDEQSLEIGLPDCCRCLDGFLEARRRGRRSHWVELKNTRRWCSCVVTCSIWQPRDACQRCHATSTTIDYRGFALKISPFAVSGMMTITSHLYSPLYINESTKTCFISRHITCHYLLSRARYGTCPGQVRDPLQGDRLSGCRAQGRHYNWTKWVLIRMSLSDSEPIRSLGTVVHPKATIFAIAGPIVIGSGCIIEEGAIIVNRFVTGPSMPFVLRSLIPGGERSCVSGTTTFLK